MRIFLLVMGCSLAIPADVVWSARSRCRVHQLLPLRRQSTRRDKKLRLVRTTEKPRLLVRGIGIPRQKRKRWKGTAFLSPCALQRSGAKVLGISSPRLTKALTLFSNLRRGNSTRWSHWQHLMPMSAPKRITRHS